MQLKYVKLELSSYVETWDTYLNHLVQVTLGTVEVMRSLKEC